MKTDGNDGAFHESKTFTEYSPDHNGKTFVKPIGLSKREYFAAMALQGICVPTIPGFHNANVPQESKMKAQMALRLADALIEELNK